MRKGSAAVIVIIVIVALIIAGGAWWLINQRNKTQAPANTTTTSEPTGTSMATNKVSIVSMTFTPGNITVAKGTTVTWTNNSATAHNVTSADGSFNSGTLNQDQTFTHTFDTTGTFNYSCTIHPSMKGTVTVTP